MNPNDGSEGGYAKKKRMYPGANLHHISHNVILPTYDP